MATPLSQPHDGYSNIPIPNDPSQLSRGYGLSAESRPDSYIANSIVPSEFAVAQPPLTARTTQSAYPSRFNEELDMSQRGSSLFMDGPSAGAGLQRSESQMSHNSAAVSRSGSTLKKKASLSRKGSLKRSGSRRSLRAGSVRSMNLGEKEKYGTDEPNSAFYVPIPTTGNPTEELANRFQAWRKVLKDLIVFFKDIQKSYETRAKLLLAAGNIVNNTALPPTFLESGGLGDATEILRDYHKQGLIEAHKAKEVESEVILQLTGLRSDLQQKTKEIKGLSGDFKNNVDKEVDNTRKAVRNLQESLGLVDLDPSATSGRHDPFILRLHVDKQVDRQIEEENYLHRAYLNLENSGRELEAIVVGEIQKAYNAYASILKREADVALDTVEKLRAGPISMPKDHEWNNFIAESENLVDPRISLRSVENISYPGKDHPAAVEIRSGMLERKSKYLKSYTPGWYVLSPTHLHEFKSADRVAFQTPVMSLYLPEQKLGSHSQPDSSSHKFMLKGRQTGAMHRGHAWVFRAESYDTMMAWFEDISNLSEKSGEARNAFVRNHVRTSSGNIIRPNSISDDGVMDEDEADQTPYSSQSAVFRRSSSVKEAAPAQRPQPGGRFPSDVQIERHLQASMSLSSGESSGARETVADTVALPGSGDQHQQQNAYEPDLRIIAYNNQPQQDSEHQEIHGAWAGNSGPAEQYRDHEHDRHFNQPEQHHPQEQSVVSSSQGPMVGSNQADPDRREISHEPNAALDPVVVPTYASSNQTSDGDRRSLGRQESQQSQQTHSTYSLMASTPASETTPPISDSGNIAASTRPQPYSKQNASTIDMFKMPGNYPRQSTG